ncbi:MAG: pyruvate, phosphate dikinase [Chloroflexi bacterium]|nr:pyruvate, phosphate dikinase [Chloroflexota bacterium]
MAIPTTTTTRLYTYFFGEAEADKTLFGNKGANLITMTRLGLPVPPGFAVSIDAFRRYREMGGLPLKEIEEALGRLEAQTGKVLGKGLMVSVRSSAPVSMPGMMDTVLNVSSREEVLSSVEKILNSWDTPRAVEYRRLHSISADLGTAAIIQAMVMGNLNQRSGTGVVFTRNPVTGVPELYGEYIPQAQGDDLVSGQKTPQKVDALREQLPQAYEELVRIGRKLETHFKDMQDIEFTVEDGQLYMLQTRSGKRSGQAAIKIAVDMVKEGVLSKEEALLRITPDDLNALLHRRLESTESYAPVAHGLNAAPGAASGKVVFSPEEAVVWAKKGERVILVRPETSPDDIQGIAVAEGVLTSRGGLTSHAAIVTRAMGKPSVCGCEAIHVDLARNQFEVGGQVVKKGDTVTIDGSAGNVYLGQLPLVKSEITPEFTELMTWADQSARLQVWANADTPELIAEARRSGAKGIGLCRTERMFNAPDRLIAIRQFILADSAEARAEALKRLKELQKKDFVAIFKALKGMPIIIRLLDMPLHEFLPQGEVTEPAIRQKLQDLREVNPMLGHRGVRLAVTYPELYRMQLEAIHEALQQEPADVSVMVPQVITVKELQWVKKMLPDPCLKLGIMVETVRACMRADNLAKEADFFSFGTNDLTQATLSFSREDAEKKFLTTYLEAGVLQDNPFEVIDVKGMGRLMETAVVWARKETPRLSIGVCGEHAGDPRSIRLFHRIGVDYVSCSPARLPVARLAAAQAAAEEKGKEKGKG